MSIIDRPSSSQVAIESAAQALYEAAAAQRPCQPPRQLLSAHDLAGAYAVQDCNIARWLGDGRRLVGWKIGLTARAAQHRFGMDQPNAGALFADMEIADEGEIPASKVIAPRVEGEVAFVLGRDLTEEAPTLAEVIRAVDFLLPALEIVDSRIEGWDVLGVDATADNAAAGLYVLGAQPARLANVDLRLCGMTLEIDGTPAAYGAGLACLGNPLNALRWLAGQAVRRGRALRAGQVILSGALGPMLPIAPGQRAEVRISGLGSARCHFSAH